MTSLEQTEDRDGVAAESLLGLAVPRARTAAGLRARADAIRTALLALALVAGTPLPAGAEPPDGISALREQALALVNESRQVEGLAPLELSDDLVEAAQTHADDMFERGYYAHESLEGEMVSDRFVDAGGSRWQLVAENIARCEGCDPPATQGTVEQLHEGWMNSPPHRENILAPGLATFGFGLTVGEDEGLYAVQTFAGPGTPRSLPPGEEPAPLAQGEEVTRAIQAINRARERAGVPALQPSDPLSQAAAGLLPPDGQEEFTLAAAEDLFAALPSGQQGEWGSLAAVAGACGGCGTAPVAADIRHFVAGWLDDPGYRERLLDPELTQAGFALRANGDGRKVAALLLGATR